MTEDDFKKHESRIYAFSVDVFSFVKTLIDAGLASEHSRMLLDTANQLYSSFIDAIDNNRELDRIVVSRCEQLSESCSDYLTKIEVGKKYLNEKVDLTIEAKEISRVLRGYLTKK
jgi:excinuclease UvrABC helicase subunit UvrB